MTKDIDEELLVRNRARNEYAGGIKGPDETTIQVGGNTKRDKTKNMEKDGSRGYKRVRKDQGTGKSREECVYFVFLFY